MQSNYIANVKDPSSGKDAVNRDYVKNGFVGNNGEQVLASSSWKIRAPNAEADDNGKLSFIDIKDNYLHLYHISDPVDPRHAVPLEYLQTNYAALTEQNTFTDTVTFDKSIYARNGIIFNGRNGATAIEVRGENESLSDIWCKVRGTNRLSFICYPGQDNSGYKRVLQMHWNDETNKPDLFIDHLMEPTADRHAVTKRYCDEKVAEAGGGSFANSGTTTPELATGQLFFNTTDKVLYIGE
jgi:hypothetical protein